MSKSKRTQWTAADYERAAATYLRSLPLEHFMEAIPQSTQRKITLESFDLLHSRCPDLEVFNELLVQYFFKGRLRRVVPDNMLRRSRQQPQTNGSFNVELEAAQPLLVLEYVSPSSMRKDYKDSFRKYEQELQVPYCLMYYPERLDLQVWHHTGTAYERMLPDSRGRIAIDELEIEVGILEGWVRFWYRGELLALPGDLQRQVDRECHEKEQALHRAEQEKHRAEQFAQQLTAALAEVARLQGLLAQTQLKPTSSGPVQQTE